MVNRLLAHDLNPLLDGVPVAPVLPAAQTIVPARRAAASAHALVPMHLDASRRAEVTAALELAARYCPGACVTLLHVLPPLTSASPVHWLGALDHLHQALSQGRHPALSALERAREDIQTWIERDVAAHLKTTLRLQGECRMGEPVAEILRFADERAVDLVLLCRHPSLWRWPLWPSMSQQLLAKLNKPVLFANLPTGSLAAPGAPC